MANTKSQTKQLSTLPDHADFDGPAAPPATSARPPSTGPPLYMLRLPGLAIRAAPAALTNAGDDFPDSQYSPALPESESSRNKKQVSSTRAAAELDQ